MELDDVLNDKPEVTQEVVEPVEPPNPDGRKKAAREKEAAAQEDGKARLRDDAGKFAKDEPEPKPEVKPEPPKQDMTDKERAFLSAAHEERRKRQALEVEIAELRKKPAEPAKPFWEDPEGVVGKVRDEVGAVKSEFTNALVGMRVGMFEEMAKAKYSDYQEKLDHFLQMAQTTPGLSQACGAAPNPAEFAYRAAKNMMDVQQAGSIDAMKANMEKELRAKWEQEQTAKQEAARKERAAIPGSLSEVRGTTQNKVVWGGPPSLEDVLGK